MSAERDTRYAEMLLSMGRSDAERMLEDPRGSHRSVAMWVAHELNEQSRVLDIPAPLAKTMREIAQQIREEPAQAPSPNNGASSRGAEVAAKRKAA